MLNLGEKLEHKKDINQKYKLFHKYLVEVIDQNAPPKPLTKANAKRKNKPWITKGILTSIGEKKKTTDQICQNWGSTDLLQI